MFSPDMFSDSFKETFGQMQKMQQAQQMMQMFGAPQQAALQLHGGLGGAPYRSRVDKSQVQCYKCQKFGHFAAECRSRGAVQALSGADATGPATQQSQPGPPPSTGFTQEQLAQLAQLVGNPPAAQPAQGNPPNVNPEPPGQRYRIPRHEHFVPPSTTAPPPPPPPPPQPAISLADINTKLEAMHDDILEDLGTKLTELASDTDATFASVKKELREAKATLKSVQKEATKLQAAVKLQADSFNQRIDSEIGTNASEVRALRAELRKMQAEMQKNSRLQTSLKAGLDQTKKAYEELKRRRSSVGSAVARSRRRVSWGSAEPEPNVRVGETEGWERTGDEDEAQPENQVEGDTPEAAEAVLEQLATTPALPQRSNPRSKKPSAKAREAAQDA